VLHVVASVKIQLSLTGNLTAICEPIYQIMWEPRRPITGIALPFVLSVQLSGLLGSRVSALFREVQCVRRKDDEELKVGSSLARIAVPHPVLQEPKSVQIMYSAYSGWISSGLGSWNVDKVTLTDSFGKR
jgi:hypothetical protein